MDEHEKKQPSENNSPDTIIGSSARRYEIHVQGHLSDIWTDWFEGFTIEWLDNGEMLLSGSVPDQAALMGILNKIHRLNLTLLSFQRKDRKK